jgi:hypothetical protein
MRRVSLFLSLLTVAFAVILRSVAHRKPPDRKALPATRG